VPSGALPDGATTRLRTADETPPAFDAGGVVEGRLEMLVNSDWVSFIGLLASFGARHPPPAGAAEATVACTQLGNELGYVLVAASKVDADDTPDGSDGNGYRVTCEGTELTLDECEFPGPVYSPDENCVINPPCPNAKFNVGVACEFRVPSGTCEECTAGTSSGVTSSTESCVPCAADTYSDTDAATSCTPCPDSTLSIPGSAECVSAALLADHEWDFRGCSNDVPIVDATGLAAVRMNGATCTAEGVSFDGVDDYVNLDDWEFGGAIAIEIYAKFDGFGTSNMMRLLEFSNGRGSLASGYNGNENVALSESGGVDSAINWAVRQGAHDAAVGKRVIASSWDEASWQHVVVTASGTIMRVFKNGVLVGTNSDGHEPLTMTRLYHRLGKSMWEIDDYFEGTIAYAAHHLPIVSLC
jgi:hypothetical protein